ncbi:MAG: VOC family protein [Actinomycetota bacterium]|nr:VOC family protein [Actinomycetota bacterium]
MGNPISWFEIHGPQPEQTSKFYSELFGWHTETMEGGYIVMDTHSGAGTNGGVSQPPPGGKPGFVIYAQDADIQALLEKAEALGGKTAMPVTEIPNMVTYATFSDPWGNVIGLMKGDENNAHVSPGDNAPMDWFQISCAEPKKAWDFYRELFGWTIEGAEAGDMVHGSVDTGSFGARGGIGNSRDGKPRVDLYAKVDDLDKYLERAESLGGTIAMPSMKVDDHTVIAMFTDPQGTTFGLYSYTE